MGYVPVPSDIGLAMVIGRGGANIKRIINSVSRCCVQPSYRPGRREVCNESLVNHMFCFFVFFVVFLLHGT